jgi:hemolysin activation/secretion protein
MHHDDALTRSLPSACLHHALAALLLCTSPLLGAAFIEHPDQVRPGAVRPGSMDPVSDIHLADNADLFVRPETVRPGPMRPAMERSFEVNEDSLAGGLDLPDAARPGAIRPGEERKAVPTPPPGELFDVPPVVDRPLEIDDGEKLIVQRFVLEGAVDRADYAIAVADVQALVDSKLAERAEGFTVGRLQEVADAVTKYYREHGLILAQAFVPVQAVEQGEVRIQIMEGLLGRVVTEGNEMYKAEVLDLPFRDLVGQPVTKEAIESALLTVSDYPGQSSFGVFQPGVRVGTADMVIKVQDEKRFETALRWDNHGINETGQNRYLGQFTVNNPLGQGDKLTGTIQRTAVPSNTFFYQLEYQVPVTGFYDTLCGVGINRNQFDVGGEFRDADIASDIRNYNASLSKNFIRSRLLNLSATARIAKKRSGTKASGRIVNIDSLAVASLEFNFDNVDARFGGLNAAYLEIAHGFNDLFGAMGEREAFFPPSRQSGTGEFAQGEFNKVLLNVSRFQALTPLWDKLKNHNLLFAGELMWSPDLLVPLEQYTVGGPTNVRGYRSTERLFDRAVFGSVEWMINAPFISDVPAFGNRTWGELFQFSLFYDVASGFLNSSLPTERKSQNLNSVGFALSFNNPNFFSSKLSFATPLGDPTPENGKDPQAWLDFNFFF